MFTCKDKHICLLSIVCPNRYTRMINSLFKHTSDTSKWLDIRAIMNSLDFSLIRPFISFIQLFIFFHFMKIHFFKNELPGLFQGISRFFGTKFQIFFSKFFVSRLFFTCYCRIKNGFMEYQLNDWKMILVERPIRQTCIKMFFVMIICSSCKL